MLEDEICRGVAATEDLIGPEALSSSEAVSDLTSCLKSNTYKSTDSAGMTKSAMGSTKEMSSNINNRKPVVHRRSYIDKVNVIDNTDDIVFKSRTKKKKHKAGELFLFTKHYLVWSKATSWCSEVIYLDSPVGFDVQRPRQLHNLIIVVKACVEAATLFRTCNKEMVPSVPQSSVFLKFLSFF